MNLLDMLTEINTRIFYGGYAELYLDGIKYYVDPIGNNINVWLFFDVQRRQTAIKWYQLTEDQVKQIYDNLPLDYL